MHRLCTLITIIALSIALAGCGGGGGGSTTPPPTTTTNAFAGTWTVPNLNLPQNQMMIGSGGQVWVAGDPPTRSGGSSPYYTRIGTCSSSGNITLSGSWIYAGSIYQISANGSVNTSSHSVSITYSLLKDSVTVVQGGSVTGSQYSDTPPPLPDFPTDTIGPMIAGATATTTGSATGQTVIIQANVADVSGVSVVEAEVTNPLGGKTRLTLTKGSGAAYSVSYRLATSSLSGTYSVVLSATDGQGNTSTSDVVTFYLGYDEPPAVPL